VVVIRSYVAGESGDRTSQEEDRSKRKIESVSHLLLFLSAHGLEQRKLYSIGRGMRAGGTEPALSSVEGFTGYSSFFTNTLSIISRMKCPPKLPALPARIWRNALYT
jgi:hypothetical protein